MTNIQRLMHSIILNVLARYEKQKIWPNLLIRQTDPLLNEVWLLSVIKLLTLFRMGFSWGSHGWGGGWQKGSSSIKSVTHLLKWWNLAQLHLSQRRSKKYMNHVTHPLSSVDISIFSPGISKFCVSRNADIDSILMHNFYLF